MVEPVNIIETSLVLSRKACLSSLSQPLFATLWTRFGYDPVLGDGFYEIITCIELAIDEKRNAPYFRKPDPPYHGRDGQ